MTKRRIALVFLVIGLVLISAAGVLIYRSLTPQVAGVLIESTPETTVYINGEQAGKTPYDAKIVPGEVLVKLVPISFDQPLPPWETRVLLTPGVKTVIRRSIAPTEDLSAGDIISFEKISKDQTAISIISTPDNAQVSLDGDVKGFTPTRLDNITPGQHQLIIAAPDYIQRGIVIKPETGYRLTAVVKLAQDPEAIAQEDIKGAQDSPEELITIVKILDTPTGFLRVRSSPTTSASESAKVDPGTTHVFVEENDTSDWFKIQYDEEGNTGWVSAQYADKIQDNSTDEAEESKSQQSPSQ